MNKEHQGERLGNWSQYMRQEGFREYGYEEIAAWDSDVKEKNAAREEVAACPSPEAMWKILAEYDRRYAATAKMLGLETK